MTKYYTGNGDAGYTGLMGKIGVKKNHRVFYAIGDLDELNSVIGVAVTFLTKKDADLIKILKEVQNDIFIIGAELSYYKHGSSQLKRKIMAKDIIRIEKEIDEIDKKTPELKNFVIPGGIEAAAFLHLARSVSRRAERSLVDSDEERHVNPEALKYLNRLSSLFFAMALYVNNKEGIKETNPDFG
jgi:cob(I)alamin adenosyltransferase